MAAILYDRIGNGYNGTRRPDPSIVELLTRAIRFKSGHRILDAACGTGNYTVEIARCGGRMTGLDVSKLMLAEACRRSSAIAWVEGSVEALPLDDTSFDAITCINAIHHFGNMDTVFGEFRRVLKPGGYLAIFTNTPEEVMAFWVASYFPNAVARSAASCLPEARFEQLAEASGLTLIERLGWLQPRDPIDLFLYSGKYRPEFYLDPAIRAGVSTFAVWAEMAELETGLARLKADIDSGSIEAVIARAALSTSDYSVFVYKRPML